MNVNDIKIHDVIRRYGLYHGELRDGQNRIPCPVHRGEHNNFSFDEVKYHCFTCGCKGNAITLVSTVFNLQRWQAVMRIKQDFGIHEEHKELESTRQKMMELKREREEKRQREAYINYVFRELCDTASKLRRKYGNDIEQVDILERMIHNFVLDEEKILTWAVPDVKYFTHNMIRAAVSQRINRRKVNHV